MKRLLSLIRRHPRSLVGLTALPLAAVIAPALDSGGSAHVQRTAPPAVARTSFRAPARPTRAVPLAAAAVRMRPVAKTSPRLVALRVPIRRHAGTPVRPGIAAAAPSTHAVALALREATGLSPAQVTARELCPPAGTDHARCAGEALVLRSDGALVHPRVAAASAAAPPAAGTPAYLQQAYDLSYLSQNQGTGDTVAVVDAYDDPTAQSDLDEFRSQFGLPPCDSGCFTKLNQAGNASPLPPSSSVWDQEISLDLDAVSAICPNCHILLVEANSSSSSDMQTAMQTAAAQGAKQISASWTVTSNSAPPGQDTFPGIATVAATGDNGYLGPGEDNYPAALPGVTAAGGTSLAPAATASPRGFSEGAWSGAGSGCDLAVPKPAWQTDTGCTGRSYADLSADADPNTGLAVYDAGQWLQFGGTSLATPLIAAYYAITGVAATSPQWAYGASGQLNDITSGSNGSCAADIAYICTAGSGYDGPTGLGSISGAAVTGAPGIGGPAISTGGADSYTASVGATSATIAGGIYRNGLHTTWSIQYGTSTQYGLATPAADIGAGSAPVGVTGELSGLQPGTTYHYRLVAQNSAGTTYGYDYTFETAWASAPSASYTISPSAPAPGTAVSFDATRSSAGTGATISSYTWSFGDGTPAQRTTGATGSHTYSARGTYTVSLTVTNSAGKTDTRTQTVTVDNPPTPAFTPSVPAGSPNALRFDASASAAGAGASIADYSWSFGDGATADTGTTSTAAHTYAAAGTYTVTLTTTDDLNVSTTVSEVVTAGAFSAAPALPTPGTQVSFTPGSTSGITAYSWNFGDPTSAGDTSALADPTHTYDQPGQYTVTLTSTSSTGQSTATETVTVDNPPHAALPTAPIIAAPGATVAFNGSSSAASSPESIKTYTWSFGDGSAEVSSNSASATHVYRATGRYAATLMVTDNLGVPATTAATQQVIVDQPAPAFSPSASALPPYASASFDASGSSDPEGTVADYSWKFGDGSSQDTGTTSSATHSYGARGAYTVTLTITNSYGQTASTPRTVTVDDPPSAVFTPSAGGGATLDFDAGRSAAMAGGSIVDYSWSFGDGSTQDTGAAATATHMYSGAGSYTVTLTTTDDLGLSATTSEQVTIQATPTSGTTPPPSPAPAPAPTSAPAPAPAPGAAGAPSSPPAPKPLTARLGAPSKQRLSLALARGLRMNLSVSQGTWASFQIMLPVTETRLARLAHPPKASSIVLLRTRARTLGTGSHAITLKLAKAAARELAGAGPLVLTVKVTLTEPGGATVTRTVKITLTR
jgi:PKD repeat protein